MSAYVVIDDSNVGAYRIVGPFDTDEQADAFVKQFDELVEREPFIRKRVIAETSRVEDPKAIVEEFEGLTKFRDDRW